MFWAQLRLAVTLLTVIPVPPRRAAREADRADVPAATQEPAGAGLGPAREAGAARVPEPRGGTDRAGAARGAAAAAGARATRDQTTRDQATGRRAADGQAAGGKTTDGQAPPSQAPPRQAPGGQAAPGQAAPRQAAPGQATGAGAPDDLRRAARGAMVWAPVIGLVLGLAAAGVLWLAGPAGRLGPLLSAVLAVATLAALSGGLHLDGLADLADGLGSRRPADEALAIMKKSDIGPFGVVALVLVLLIQVAALDRAESIGRGVIALVAAAVTSRLAMTAACRRGVPAARGSGLGVLVAGSVPWPAVAGLVIADLAAAAAFGWVYAAGVAAGLVVSAGVTTLAVRRLGGITGDVLGATAETTMAACLLFSVIR